MAEIITNAVNWCSNNKKFFGVSIVSFIVCGFLIFPYDDLTGFVTDTVYTSSNNRVTLMASGLSLSIYPLGLKLSGQAKSPLTIDSLDFPPNMPPLELESLAISPSISSLLKFKSGFFAQMKGLFGGTANIKFREGDRVSDQSETHKMEVDLNADEIALNKFGSFLSLPMQLKGLAEMDINAIIDPEFKGQPNSEFDLEIENLRLVGFNYLGMAVPTLDFKSARIKGKLIDGRLMLEEVQLGEKGDDMHGVIRGELGLRLQKSGATVQPQFGSYKINVDLTTANKFASTLSLLDVILPDIKKYKTTVAGGTRFKVALNAPGFTSTPKLSEPRR